MSKHSKEPWKQVTVMDCGEAQLVDAGHGWIATLGKADLSHADARRIIACVNVLAGVPTEMLERVIEAGARLVVFEDSSGGLNCDMTDAP